MSVNGRAVTAAAAAAASLHFENEGALSLGSLRALRRFALHTCSPIPSTYDHLHYIQSSTVCRTYGGLQRRLHRTYLSILYSTSTKVSERKRESGSNRKDRVFKHRSSKRERPATGAALTGSKSTSILGRAAAITVR